jgi:hypothetical protein
VLSLGYLRRLGLLFVVLLEVYESVVFLILLDVLFIPGGDPLFFDFSGSAILDYQRTLVCVGVFFWHGHTLHTRRRSHTHNDCSLGTSDKAKLGGHARNAAADLKKILAHKNHMLGDIVFSDRSTLDSYVSALANMKSASPSEAFSSVDRTFWSQRFNCFQHLERGY